LPALGRTRHALASAAFTVAPNRGIELRLPLPTGIAASSGRAGLDFG
jgi:hypothetical protein